MPDHFSAVSGAFRRPFAEQVAFFRQKMGNVVPTRRWDDLTGAAHDTAFMVAGAQKAELLHDLAASIDRAIAEGKSLEAFRRDFEAAVERHDWHGWTGEDTKGGRAWRTRTIYRTNTYTSYAAGRFAQLTAANWAFWVYRHGGSKDPRPEHLNVFDGLVLPPDHPFWVKHYPPSDWGCSCYVVGARSERGAKRLGGDPAKTLPDGWDKIDPATGEPAGVGKGWGYAPGASVAAAVNAKAADWPAPIAQDFRASLPPPPAPNRPAPAAPVPPAPAAPAPRVPGAPVSPVPAAPAQPGSAAPAASSLPPPPSPLLPPPRRSPAERIVSVDPLADVERGATTDYTGKPGKLMNSELKAGRLTRDASIVAGALAKASFPEATTLYRGVNRDSAAQLLEYAVGEAFVWSTFFSTSRSRRVARNFMRKGALPRILMIIRVPKGAAALDVASISEHSAQEEVLFQFGTWFRVVSWDEKRRILHVDVLP